MGIPLDNEKTQKTPSKKGERKKKGEKGLAM